MKALTFHIRLLQPLLVTQLGAGEENSSTAFDFIPGSVLRGDLINRYVRKHQIADAAQDPTSRHLFFDGEVRYLNAYPINRLGQRMLPTPFSWRVGRDERDDPHTTIYDFAVEQDASLDNPTLPAGTFFWRDGGQVEFDNPDRFIGVHNASENRNVKRKGQSTVYRYEAIAAGKTFGAVILSENEMDLQTLHSLVDGIEINLGGSRSAGYGRVRFEHVQLESDWREYETDEDPDDGILIVTLVSDAILYDRNGQPATNLDTVLGWKHLRGYQRARIVSGFNRKWGLPLVQAPALQAGSVFVYPADQVDRQVLLRLEQEGVGKRRAEGFGRIAINWHTQATLQRRPVPQGSTAPSVPLSDEIQQLAQKMAERRFRTVLDQKLIEAVGQLSITRPPSNTQLSRLRLALRHGWRQGKSELILNHLENLKASKEQFEQARIGNERLFSWLKGGVEKNTIWENWLKPTPLPSLAGVTVQPNDAIKLEYTVRLLDALLKKATGEPD